MIYILFLLVTAFAAAAAAAAGPPHPHFVIVVVVVIIITLLLFLRMTLLDPKVWYVSITDHLPPRGKWCSLQDQLDVIIAV